MVSFKQIKLFLFIAFSQHLFIEPTNSSTVYVLEPSSRIHVLPEIGNFGYAKLNMNTFCYKGVEKELPQLFKNVFLNIEIEDDDFTCFFGNSAEDVKTAQESHKSIFSFNLFSHSKKKNVKVNPFNSSCIGIETANEYIVSLKTIKVDPSRLGLLITGLLLFFLSSKLSANSAFFYVCGVLLGVFASVLVLIWFISKLIPKKPLMYGALFSGWALVAYIGQMLFDNIQPFLIIYQKYVLIYILTTSIISFAVCYYMGPPKNKRTKQLIMWALQLLGLLFVYFSSDFCEASFTIVVSSIATYYFPFKKLLSLRRIWAYFFPPKPKLLTKEEFEELGRRETEKALRELREYVRSPNCKQWKVVMNLSQPTRFASFVEGDSHLTLDETREYENTINDFTDTGDDTSSDDSFIEESIAVDKSLNIINKSRLKQLQSAQTNMNKTSTPATNGKLRKMASRNASMLQNKSFKNGTNKNYELSEDDD